MSTTTGRIALVLTPLGVVLAIAALVAGARPPSYQPIPHDIAPPVASPVEPPTRTLSPDEAREVLEADWLFQAEERPLLRRARQEIGWAREIAARITQQAPATDLSRELGEIAEIERRLNGLPRDADPVARVRSSPRPNGLAALWTFDEEQGDLALDGSGKGRTATNSGWLERESGVSGRALRFAQGGALTAGSAPACFGAARYTVAAWVRTTSQEADILGTGVGPGHVLLMAYRGVVRAHHWTAEDGNVLDGRARVDDNRWHHVAAVCDGRSLRIYVDGAPDGERPFIGRPLPLAEPMTIGGRGPATASSAFSGSLDDLAVYDRALTPQEIAAEAASCTPPDPSVHKPDPTALRIYLAVRDAKRRIFMKSPEVTFDTVLFIDQPYPTGSEWRHEARHRNGMMAVPGGRLLKLQGLSPAGTLTKLAAPRPGSFWSPDVSFDGKRVLFCWKPWDEPSFHLYEIGADGSGLRQLTSGPYDDIDPIYLPDGQLAFASTRCNTYVRCMPYTYSYVLARCDPEGGNVYLISQNSEPDWCPTLMHDGRLIYSRWEYTDKALWRIQSLWTTNPDGTNTATFWGNQSVWPDHLAEPRAIPGSRRIMFTGLAHHDWFAGSIGIIDADKGRNFPLGLTKVTCETPWPECGRPPTDPREKADYHTSGRFGAYKTPYPLSERVFLVSAERGGKFALYLMDVWGNRELIYEGAHHIWHAMPLAPRRKPPVVSSSVRWPGTGEERKPAEPGVLYSSNVLQGVPELRGKAKAVRVIQMDPKTYTLWERDSRYSGPSMSCFQEDGVKRILGTAPIEPDGSVSMRVPAGQPLHFQLLDSQGRALQTMRSFAGVMPGERRGCVGCHEMHSVSPGNRTSRAMRRAPSDLTPPTWGAESLSYERFVRPTLDRYCSGCHQGAGAGRKQIDFTPRGSGVYVEPYVSLVTSGLAGAILCENYDQSDPKSYLTFAPGKGLSSTSRLVRNATSGLHHGVRVDTLSAEKLIAWVDANCPYRGEEEVRVLPDPDFPGIERLAVRPRCRTAPVIPRP